jgi:hypothetical protein
MISNEQQIESRNARVDSIKPSELKKCLMQIGYFPEANIFPPIYEVSITRSGQTSKTTTEPVGHFVTKSQQKWRDFKLLKPENYMQTVNTIVDNYDQLEAHFSKTKKILSYTTPIVYSDNRERPGFQINNWLDMHKDMLAASSENRLTHLVQIDIQSCYETLYTHTLEWALGRLGSKFDLAIRRGNKNRTHGLPIGPYVSDILAEVVLCWLDKNIEKELNNLDYLGYRYRDNYYFLCRGSTECEKILGAVSEKLRDAHFTVNDSKTRIGLYTEYQLSMWQTEHKLLVQSLGLKSKGAVFTNEKLQVFIDQSLKISEKFNNSNNILEKTVNIITEGDFKGIIDFNNLFYSISAMLPMRTLSYPKILAYLKKLTQQHPFKLKAIYKKFLINEIENAYSRKDAFALMWLTYVVADIDDESIKTLALDRLSKMRRKSKIVSDMLTYVKDPAQNITLWETNDSQIKLARKDYLSADELFDYLGISFGES